MDPFKFEIMTRRLGHEAVLRSLDSALSSALQSVKLNVVVIKGLNDYEVLDFVEMTKDKALSVRFIEFMPFTGAVPSRVPAECDIERLMQGTSGTRPRWCRPPNCLLESRQSTPEWRKPRMN